MYSRSYPVVCSGSSSPAKIFFLRESDGLIWFWVSWARTSLPCFSPPDVNTPVTLREGDVGCVTKQSSTPYTNALQGGRNNGLHAL